MLFLFTIFIGVYQRFCLMIFRVSVGGLLTLWCWLLGLIFRAFCCVNYVVFHVYDSFSLSNVCMLYKYMLYKYCLYIGVSIDYKYVDNIIIIGINSSI